MMRIAFILPDDCSVSSMYTGNIIVYYSIAVYTMLLLPCLSFNSRWSFICCSSMPIQVELYMNNFYKINIYYFV